jgi:hypothetical protein
MRIGLLILLAQLTIGAQTVKTPELKLTPYTEGNETQFVLAANQTDATEAIVRICYWTEFPGIPGKLVRCHDSVIPVVEGAGTMSDPVPVDLADVQSVKVRLVRILYEQTFPYKMTP